MRAFRILILLGLCFGLAAAAWAAGQCLINFASHGTFKVVSTADGTCLQFVDLLGNPWEITNPRGNWTDGLTGTVIGNTLATGSCSQNIGPPLEVCQFDADTTRNVVGIFDENQFVQCPGFVIRTQNATLRIVNCEEIGPELCSFDNVGRRIMARVFVDAGITNCVDPGTTVLDFRFLQ